jgi:DNA (cytosine-5)-methyltransferase 1
MSWLFSQALVEEYSEASSLDGAQSAQSSGSHTQQAYCAPDKMTAFSKLSRFGMTYKPLTESHGRALLMSYLGAFHAKTSQPQGGGGITGARSSMWKHMARIISEVGPRFVFVENSPMLTSRGLGVVLGDLAQMGFDAKWGVLGADLTGAAHRRDRIWLVAHSNRDRLDDWESEWNRTPKQKIHSDQSDQWDRVWSKSEGCVSFDDWKSLATEFLRMDDGMANRMDRLKAIGNGQVPVVAEKAWRILNDR